MYRFKSLYSVKKWRLLVAIIFAFAAIFANQASVYAIDEVFFSGNDILFYKPGDNCAPTTNSAIANNKVYIIGDSYTDETDGLPANGLTAKLTANGYTISKINHGVGRSISTPGNKGPEFDALKNNDPSPAIDAIEKDQSYISESGTMLVVLGTNTEDKFSENIAAFMTKVHNYNPTIRTYWVNVNYVKEDVQTIPGKNTALEKNASQSGYTVINWYSASKGKDYWVSDGIHPNKAGYKVLVDLIALNIGPAASATNPVTNRNGKNKIYVVGDSYTRELRARGFESALTDAGYQVVGYNASGGRSITQVGHDGDNSSGLSALTKDAAAIASADTALVILGTNGVAADKEPPSPDPYDMTKADIGNFMNALHKAHGNNNIKTYWVNLNFIGNNGQPFDVSKANETLSANASSLNYSVIDWYAKTKNNTKSFLVDKHPNENGWSLLKTTILSALGPAAASPSAPSTTPSSGTMVTSKKLDENARQLWQYLIGKGLTPIQTAGVMGNLQRESSFNPREHEKGTDTDDIPTYDDYGYGIVQWSFDRKKVGMVKYLAEYQKKNPSAKGSDLQMQADYMWKELNTPNSRWNESLNELKQATNVRDAVHAILFKYEEPGDIYNEWDIRTTYANELLQKYSGLNGINFENGGKCASDSSSAAGAYGWDLEGPNAMVYYSQYDPKWASQPFGDCTIGEGACGPTSIAMIVSTIIDKNITLLDVIKYMNTHGHTGCGTHADELVRVAKHYGLKITGNGHTPNTADFDKAVDVIKRGGFVIGLFGPGLFTTTGHYMVLRKTTADGKKFYIADPIAKDRQNGSSTKAFDREFLVDFSGGKGALEQIWYIER